MTSIQFKKELSEEHLNEKELVKKILLDYGNKLEKRLGEELTIEIHTKDHGKIKSNNVDVTLRILCSGSRTCSKHFFEANANDKNLLKAIHITLSRLNTEIEHKLRLSDQGKR